MDSRRTAESNDSPEHSLATSEVPASARDPKSGLDGWLATPAIAILVVVCCAGPLLLASLAATGAGAWLAAHGYPIGAAALLVLGAFLAWRTRARLSRG